MAESVEDVLELQREYPVRVTTRDGIQAIVYIYAITEQFAHRAFDDMFMSLHGTRKLLPVDSVEPVAHVRNDVVRMELLDYLSDVVLADYKVKFESEV